ncbi:DUF4232 domain-containing protein [Streptomyces sp. NPDC088196]|uniref:DUF4232 domain-containing protein n=1 Tax=Streptomyces sp. NPDC088196 TaxID=3154868 RepID=UPI00344D7050
MSAFTARPRTRLFAAATVALAALSLTACNDKLGVQDEGAATPTSSTVATSAPTGAKGAGSTGSNGSSGSTGSTSGGSSTGNSSTGGGAGSSAGKTSGGSGSGSGSAGSSSGSGSDTSTSRVPCNGANTKVTAQTVSSPINHMLLTATNTGSKTCDLYYYPAVNFDDAQSVPPVMKDSQPQAVTTLAPGESGYAGVALSGGDNGTGTNGRTAKSLSVYFFDRNNNSISPAATPALPAKGVYVDDSLKVTYWVSDAQDALTY